MTEADRAAWEEVRHPGGPGAPLHVDLVAPSGQLHRRTFPDDPSIAPGVRQGLASLRMSEPHTLADCPFGLSGLLTPVEKPR